jgi:hypothetical protein
MKMMLMFSVLLLSLSGFAKLTDCDGGFADSFSFASCGSDDYCNTEAICTDTTTNDRTSKATYTCKAITTKGQKACPTVQECVERGTILAKSADYVATPAFQKPANNNGGGLQAR